MIATNVSSAKPPLVESEQLLIDLHRLIREGEGESDDADAIRDRMDTLWRKLDKDARQHIRGLSADLSDLKKLSNNGNENGGEDVNGSQAFWSQLKAAREAADYQVALRLLRDSASQLPTARLLGLRASCYEKLGEVDVALEFYRAAAELESLDGPASSLLLTKLLGLGEPQAAFEWASQLQTMVAHPRAHTLVQMAIAYRAYADTLSAEQAAPVLRDAIALFNRAIGSFKSSQLNPRDRRWLLNATVGRGVCQLLLSHRDAAKASFDEAIRLDATDEAALTMRGLMLWDEDPRAAIDDFRRAIELHSSSVWPYFYAALDALSHNDYQTSLAFSDAAAGRTSDPELRATLFEWMAISLHELGGPEDDVRNYFETAVALAPMNQRIVENYELFQAHIRRRDKGQNPWVLEKDFDPDKAVQIAGRGITAEFALA